MTASSSQNTILISLTYNQTGAEESEQYAITATTITATAEGTFAPKPATEVEFSPQAGTADDNTVTITMPKTGIISDFADRISVPEITVRIYTCDPSDVDNTITLRWLGYVRRVVANASGRRDILRVTCGGIKSKLTGIIAGITASTRCPWPFGSCACGVKLSVYQEDVDVASISGRDITLTGLSITTAGYWQRGWVRLGDLAILVRKQLAGSVFTLERDPPADWDGETVTVTPGCDKTIQTCRNTWNNETRFGGCALATPARNPLIG